MALSIYEGELTGVLIPRWPMEFETAMAVHRPDNPYVDERSLIGRTSGWIRGYPFDDYLPQGVSYRELDSVEQGLGLLQEVDIDFLIDHQPEISSVTAAAGFDLSKFQQSRVRALSREVFPAFRDDARGQTIMEIYDHRMSALHASANDWDRLSFAT